MFIKRYAEYITEKSIGSENIRLKYYPDLEKEIFYKIVNLDPTSIRKKDFSKPGKYVKWLIIQYRKGNLNFDFHLQSHIQLLRERLFVYSTSLGKRLIGDIQFMNSLKISSNFLQRTDATYSTDIFKYKTVADFMKTVSKIYDEWNAKSEDSKVDLVYEDENIMILVPLNFTACYEYSKNTDWCSQSLNMFHQWTKYGMLYRFINKKTQDRYRLTWLWGGRFSWATTRYPELDQQALFRSNNHSPFDFESVGTELENDVRTDRLNKLKEMWKLMSPKSIQFCKSYFEKNKKY